MFHFFPQIWKVQCWPCKLCWSSQWNVSYKCWQPFNSLTLSILLSVSVLSLTHKTTLFWQLKWWWSLGVCPLPVRLQGQLKLTERL